MKSTNDLTKQIKEKWNGYNNEEDSITLKILYNMSKNTVIEEKKEELSLLFKSALNNFKNSTIGARYAKEGWLEPNIIKDGLHNIILNSSTCKKLDEIFDDYTLDYIVFFSECCEDYSSPVYSAITAYQYLCQIEEEEKKQIDNDVQMLDSILGSYITNQIQIFQLTDDTYIYNSKNNEVYRKLWDKAKCSTIKFYTEKGTTGRRDYKNIRIILDTIDKVFNYYIKGPKKIDLIEKGKVKSLQQKSS